MVKMTFSSVTLELSVDDLETIRAALRALVHFGDVDDADRARAILADIEGFYHAE